MSRDAEPVKIEDLLAHAEWLRRLARSLVADPQGADDVVQETWLAALRRPPRHASRVRAWLATVVRNAVRARGRSEAQRRRREERVSRSDVLPDPAALVDRAEMRRRLAGHVLELPEPYRMTVLLRFDEDLELHEIARRTGIPASTVRGRLQRGLTLLRERLDRENAGERKAWLSALLPLAGFEAARAAVSGGVVAGGLLMGTKVKVGLGMALALILAVLVFLPDPSSPAPEGGPARRSVGAVAPAEPNPGKETPAETVEPLATWAITGRVLDSGRHPAVGVPVELWRDGDLRRSVLSGDGGHFRLVPYEVPLGESPRFVLWARDRTGRGALRTCYLRLPRTEDYATRPLILEEGHPLEVIVEFEGQSIAGARVDILGGLQRREGPVISAKTDAGGSARFPALPPEQFHVVASAEGFASTARFAGLPWMADGPLRLELAMPRNVEIEIVEGPDECPVVGVVMYVSRSWSCWHRSGGFKYHPRLTIPPTDETGRTRIEGLARDPSLELGLAARGFAKLVWSSTSESWRPSILDWIPIPVREDRMRIVLPPSRSVVWPVVAGEVPVPPDGTRIVCRLPRIRGPFVPPGIEAGVMESGNLVVTGLTDKPFVAIAETPDGALARISVGAKGTAGPTVSFARPRTLVVLARREDGSPAADLGIGVRALEGSGDGYGEADAAGLVRMAGLVAGKADIHAQGHRGPVGIADLTAGDARVEVTVPVPPVAGEEDAGIPVRLRVRLSGVKGLPASYGFDLPWDGSSIRVEEEDPDEGVLLTRWCSAPGKHHGKITLISPDHAPLEVSIGPETTELVFDLEPAGQMLYRVLCLEGQRVSPRLQRAVGSGWVDVRGKMGSERFVEPPLYGRAHLRRGVTPGRYRAIDKRSGIISEEVTVRAGEAPAVLTLDARPPGEITGLVVGPPGADLRGAHVEVTRAGAGAAVEEVPIGDDGRFRVPLRNADEETHLTVRHPLLRAHAETGHLRLRGSHEEVTLQLIRGGVVTIAIAIEEAGGPLPKPPRSPRILLLLKPDDREAVRSIPAEVDAVDQGRWRLRFTGHGPGMWTLWFQPSRTHAPIVLEDMDLDGEDADLGTVRLVRGSTIRASLNLPEEGGPFIVSLRAEALDGPPLVREDLRVDATELAVSGLGRGRFRVRARLYRADESEIPTDLDEVIVVDGRTDHARTIRLVR